MLRAGPHQKGHGEAAECDGVGGGGGDGGAHHAVRACRVMVAAEEGQEVADMHLQVEVRTMYSARASQLGAKSARVRDEVSQGGAEIGAEARGWGWGWDSRSAARASMS